MGFGIFWLCAENVDKIGMTQEITACYNFTRRNFAVIHTLLKNLSHRKE